MWHFVCSRHTAFPLKTAAHTEQHRHSQQSWPMLLGSLDYPLSFYYLGHIDIEVFITRIRSKVGFQELKMVIEAAESRSRKWKSEQTHQDCNHNVHRERHTPAVFNKKTFHNSKHFPFTTKFQNTLVLTSSNPAHSV